MRSGVGRGAGLGSHRIDQDPCRPSYAPIPCSTLPTCANRTRRSRRKAGLQQGGEERPRQQDLSDRTAAAMYSIWALACDDGPIPSCSRNPTTSRSRPEETWAALRVQGVARPEGFAFAPWGGVSQGGNDARIEVER